MSKSYKKKSFHQIVCMRPTTVKKIKRLENRRYRHLLKQGVYDDQIPNKTLFKRISNLPYSYDIFTLYYDEKKYENVEWYKKAMRK